MTVQAIDRDRGGRRQVFGRSLSRLNGRLSRLGGFNVDRLADALALCVSGVRQPAAEQIDVFQVNGFG